MTLLHLRHRLRVHRRIIIRCVLGAMACFLLSAVLLLAWPMNTDHYLKPDSSPMLLDRNGFPLYSALNNDEQWCFPVALDAVSPHLVNVTLAAEDQRFYQHVGIDLRAIGRATLQNMRHRRVRSGASTITMQLVKLADQETGSSTLPQKLRQMIQALRLEVRVDKERILAAYLNHAPYTRNIRGCEAASRRLFGKPALELTLQEAALLAGLPKAPTALDPVRHPEKARKRRDYVLQRMHAEKMLDAQALQVQTAGPLGIRIHAFPSSAPHLALSNMEELQDKKIIQTTLDLDIQQRAQVILADEMEKISQRTHGGVSNGAALILRASDVSVLAWIGSADFNDKQIQGQFNAAQAIRPAGSTLKPFLYALAMQKGRLYPSEVLLDAPMDRGLYKPRNFDESHAGHVPADRALRESLNIPALGLLHRVGIADFHAFLQECGFQNIKESPEIYGLGLALGNGGVQLSELAAAYGVLANRGEYRPLAWRLGQERPARVLLAPDVASQISAILRQNLITEETGIQATERRIPMVAWKTGTSTGRHDAWTVLYDNRYIIAVWVGNNDYASDDQLVGSQAALPIATALFKSLPDVQSVETPSTRDDYRSIRVCSATGLPANRNCPATREVAMPRSIAMLRVCDVHHLSPAHLAGADSRQSLVEYWPPGPLGWDLAATPRDTKTLQAQTTTLNIIQPSEGAHFIRTNAASGDRIRLASSLDQRHPIHWYLNGQFLGSSQPSQPLHLDLRTGEHHLSALTPHGESAQVRFRVTGSSEVR